MFEAALAKLLTSLPGEAIAIILALWAAGQLGLSGLKLWLDRRQRGQMVDAVKETGCQYPSDLVHGTRRALLLQDRIAEEQATALKRMEEAIHELVTAMGRRDQRQADTLQALSNSLALLAEQLRTQKESLNETIDRLAIELRALPRGPRRR